MTAAYSVMDFDPSVVAEGVDARSWPRLSGLRRSKNFTTENTEGHGGPLRFFATALTDSDLSTAFNNKGTPNNKATPNHYHVGSSSCPGRPRASCPRHPRAQPHTHRDKCRAEHDLRFVVILGLEPRIARIMHGADFRPSGRFHRCSGRARA